MANTRPMDLLQDHLTRARASGGVFARTVAKPPWGLRLAGTIQLAAHAVVEGRAWLWLDDPDSPLELVRATWRSSGVDAITTSRTSPPPCA